jgi:hypothetical protein
MTTTSTTANTVTATARFGFMTNNLDKLRIARELAAQCGFSVDMLPMDAPTPEPGTYDGIMVDFAAGARHALARKTYLEKLTRMARAFPVVVYDQGTTYQEAAIMRAAGIKWFAVLKAKVFEAMLAHPLAKAKAEKAAEGQQEPAGSEVASTAE